MKNGATCNVKMVIKTKTTSQIERKLYELILDSKDLERIEKREEFLQKEWIALSDLKELFFDYECKHNQECNCCDGVAQIKREVLK